MELSVFFDHILEAHEQTGKDIRLLLNTARGFGIGAVELSLPHACGHSGIRELLSDAGMRAGCLYGFYAMNQSDEREKARRHVSEAVRLGATHILVVPGFFSVQEAAAFAERIGTYEDAAGFLSASGAAVRMAEGLSYITELGAREGVTVTVEDFDDAKSPLSSVHGVSWFLSQVPGLRVTFDTGNFIIHGEDIFGALEALLPKVSHVHCKDRGQNPVPAGGGTIPVGSVVRRLLETGYGGRFAIEHFGAEDQLGCMEASARYLLSLAVRKR